MDGLTTSAGPLVRLYLFQIYGIISRPHAPVYSLVLGMAIAAVHSVANHGSDASQYV